MNIKKYQQKIDNIIKKKLPVQEALSEMVVELKDYDFRDIKEADVKRILKEQNIPWSTFREWMVGQTCPLIDGKPGYFVYDVERFINNKKKGTPLIWD